MAKNIESVFEKFIISTIIDSLFFLKSLTWIQMRNMKKKKESRAKQFDLTMDTIENWMVRVSKRVCVYERDGKQALALS